MTTATLIARIEDRRSIADIVEFSKRTISRARGKRALDVDLYSKDDLKRPLSEARWTVAKFKWNGFCWQRERKFGGPRRFEAALEELEFQCRRLNYPKISEV